MKQFIVKLLLGDISKLKAPKHNPIAKRILNIKAIWNNDHQDDNGIEKIIRLFLSSSQLLFPGIYIKYIASKIGIQFQEIAMDFYIIFKVIFPIFILKYHLFGNNIVVWFLVYLLLETLLYIPTLIFASDLYSRPKSYKRSMILLFFNYCEIVLSFAVLYSLGDYMNEPFKHWFDAVYFSTITSSSIGYGDFYPVTTYGKFLVCIQAMLFLLFVVLFLNFFSTSIKSKGYFDHENEN